MSAALDQLPELSSMGVSVYDPIWGSAFHQSGKAELLTVLRGELDLEFENESFPMVADDLAVIPPRALHRDGFDPSASPELFMTQFSWSGSETFFGAVSNSALKTLSEYQRNVLLKMISRLRDASPSDDPVEKTLIRALLHALLLTILKFVRERDASELEVEEGLSRQKRLMLEAKRYLEEHFDEIVTLESMAAKLDVSTYYLSRIFSRESGFSLVSYLTSVRMDHAMELLKWERAPVAEVAECVGYENSGYFSKVFKNTFGVVPSAVGIKAPPRRR